MIFFIPKYMKEKSYKIRQKLFIENQFKKNTLRLLWDDKVLKHFLEVCDKQFADPVYIFFSHSVNWSNCWKNKPYPYFCVKKYF